MNNLFLCVFFCKFVAEIINFKILIIMKNRLPVYWSLLVLGCTIVSCSSENYVEAPTEKKPLTNHSMSLQKALDRGRVFWNGMTVDKPATRSRGFADIESVKYIVTEPRTRGGNASDTIFYLVNYKNEEGFMLLSADERMLPVYAMSDQGHLDLNDTTFNEGLRIFYNQARTDAMNIPSYPRDTTIHIGVDPLDYRFDRTVKPKFSKDLRSVSQYAPFNKYCFTTSGEQALVGCGPLAIGSILAYYNVPNYIGNRSLRWDAINSNIKHDDFCYLVSVLGQYNYLEAEYGTTSTPCSYNKISTVFEKFGFEPAPLVAFDDKQAAIALEKNPIVVYGQREPKGAHLWVMDGYIRYGLTHNIMTGPEPGREPPYFFFHCCWGWGGKSNGYFYYNLNGALDNDNVIYNSDDDKTYTTNKYANLKMINHFKKK